jgi:MFS family permease
VLSGKLSAVPRPVYFYLAASFFMGLANTIFDTVFNFYLEERGIHEAGAGLIYAVATGAMAVAVVPLLLLRRVVSPRHLLIGASVLYALPFAGLPFVKSVPAAAIVLSLILSGMLALLSVGNSIAGAHVPESARTRLFSAFFICYLGAGALGSAIVSLGSSRLPLADLDKYRCLLAVALAAALVMLVLRIPSAEVAAEEAAAASETGTRKPGELRNLVAVFIAAGFLGASIALVFRFANVVFAQAYGLPIGEISLILGGDKIVSIFGAIFAPLVVRRFSLRPSAAVIGALVFAGLVLQSFVIPLTVFVVLYLLRLLLNYGTMPLLDTVAMAGFERSRQLVSISLRQASFYLGGAVAAAVYGRLLGEGHWQAALWVSAGCALVGTLAMTWVRDAGSGPRHRLRDPSKEQVKV